MPDRAVICDGQMVRLIRPSYNKAGVNVCRHKALPPFVEAEFGAVKSDGYIGATLVPRVNYLFISGNQSKLSSWVE